VMGVTALGICLEHFQRRPCCVDHKDHATSWL
jgi:hypothetical protein